MLNEKLEFWNSAWAGKMTISNQQSAIGNALIQHSAFEIQHFTSFFRVIAGVYESRTCIEAGRSDRSIPARGHQ